MKINRLKQFAPYVIGWATLLALPLMLFAVTFNGSVKITGGLAITGAISKGSGTFLIDHPLDPANKLLYHSFVESPDVKNIYDGVATLNSQGEVTLEMPGYFLALNKDFRYQFFPMDGASPNLYLKKGAEGDARFTIAGGKAGERISWQITGIRHDPYIQAYPINVEVEKGPDALVDKGEYLFEGYAEE